MEIKGNKLLSRQIIQEHYLEPKHKRTPADSWIKQQESADGCIDDITVGIKIENNIIKEASFDGVGCAITTASTDILIDMIINKPVSEAILVLNNFQLMTSGKEYDEQLMGEANCVEGVKDHPIRIKCAQLPVMAITKIIKKLEGELDV